MMHRSTLAAFAAIAVAVVSGASPLSAEETRASAAAKFAAEFAASDTNHDGSLSEAEVIARVGRMRVGKGAPDKVHAKRLADLWFTRADADHDGKVTQAEAQALLAMTFDRYDTNHDGRIGPDEKGSAKKSLGR